MKSKPLISLISFFPLYTLCNLCVFFLVILLSFNYSYAIEEMTLEEKVGQLLMVHFHGEHANEEARTLIQDTHVGSIIYYNWANGLHSPEQVKALSSGLQTLARNSSTAIPLLIATDQEGGVVVRLTKGFTIFPGNKALGMTDESDLAELSAFAMGQELRAVGVNMNLAPVVDVNNNPRNPIIGIRSFDSDPEKVKLFAEKALQGYKNAGVITSLKHFPGHGDVEIDSHEALPILNKTKNELSQLEFIPFAYLAKQADSITTAHILIPSIDSKNCATLSPKILTILRNEIGYKGVILTDSLVMEGLLKNCASIDEAAIQAFNAGCDILVLGGKQLISSHASHEQTTDDVRHIHASLVNAVKNGRISESRLNQAVANILELKSRYQLELTPNPSDQVINELVKTPANQALAKKIAVLALRVKIKDSLIDFQSLREKKVLLLAPEILKDSLQQTSFEEIGLKTSSQYFAGLNPTDIDVQEAFEKASHADVLIVFSYNAWRSSAQQNYISLLLKLQKPLILVVTRDPLDAELFSEAAFIIKTFSPTEPSLQAAYDRILKGDFVKGVY